MADYCDAIRERSESRWVTRSSSKRSVRVRLFCFPYAGGGTGIFRAWQNELPSAFEVCALALPGREGRLREPPFERLEPLVNTLSEAIQPYLDLPFAFFGHSMGALVAFEVVRQLRRRRWPTPLHLFVSGRGAPQLCRSRAPIHHLPRNVFVEELRRLKGTPEEVIQNEEALEIVLPALRADFAAFETYVYSVDAPLDCPISVFGGRDDADVAEADLAAWKVQTHGHCVMQLFDGDHFYLRSARHQLLSTIVSTLMHQTGYVDVVV